jgi:hypothetical protein
MFVLSLSPNSCVEVLTPNVMEFRGKAFERKLGLGEVMVEHHNGASVLPRRS